MTEIFDETYKGMWFSPKVNVLLTTTHSLANPPVAWISPYAQSRVVVIQPGHGSDAHRHAGYRRLVKNAVLWTAGRLPEDHRAAPTPLPASVAAASSRP